MVPSSFNEQTNVHGQESKTTSVLRFLLCSRVFVFLFLKFHLVCFFPWLNDPSLKPANVTQLLPAPVWPKTKLSGRKSWPKGPARTLSMVPAKYFKLNLHNCFVHVPCWTGMIEPQRIIDPRDLLVATGAACYLFGFCDHCQLCIERSIRKQPKQSWFQIHQDGTWHITATGSFVEVDVNTFLFANVSEPNQNKVALPKIQKLVLTSCVWEFVSHKLPFAFRLFGLHLHMRRNSTTCRSNDVRLSDRWSLVGKCPRYGPLYSTKSRRVLHLRVRMRFLLQFGSLLPHLQPQMVTANKNVKMKGVKSPKVEPCRIGPTKG